MTNFNRYPLKLSGSDKPDTRYTIDLEYCGAVTPKYVMRFCGIWVTCSMKLKHAIENAVDHNIKRLSRG